MPPRRKLDQIRDASANEKRVGKRYRSSCIKSTNENQRRHNHSTTTKTST
jgi:hypothetical protein